MKREDEAQLCTSKMEKKEARKNAFLEIILWSDYLEFPFLEASYCYLHYTIYWQKKNQQPPQKHAIVNYFYQKSLLDVLWSNPLLTAVLPYNGPT